jgi:ElaB/YqjD/DUF883 family membrane-anchored ribosome-binding protein
MSTVDVSREKLAQDFRTVVADSEELVKATAQETGERIKNVRSRLEHTLQSARTRAVELERQAVERARTAAKATDRYAHEKPWQTAAVAAGVGLLIGLLIGRRL